MIDTRTPLDGWDVCAVDGCPLSDPNADEPDNIDEIRDTGVAHGVRHVDISDHWWTRSTPTPGLADDNRRVLAAAAWLARREGRDYCIRSVEHSGEWNGYQLMASDLLATIDREAPR